MTLTALSLRLRWQVYSVTFTLIRVPEKKQEDNPHIRPCGSSHHIGAYITITLKFQKLFILFVAAFHPDNSVFCEKMRMSLGTMELI